MYVETLARSGSVCGEIGNAWHKHIDEEKKFVRLKQTAEGGDAEAMRAVAKSYDRGRMGAGEGRREGLSLVCAVDQAQERPGSGRPPLLVRRLQRREWD